MEKQDHRREVESHSSMISNERVGKIKELLWKLGFENMSSKPNPFKRLELFAAIVEYYLETKDVYMDNDLELINKEIRKGNKLAARMRVTGNVRDMENLLQISLAAQAMINTALQKMRYFFRLGRQSPRGIDAALEQFGENIWEEADAKA